MLSNPLEPRGFTGFGAGYYCPVAAWPEDTRPMTARTESERSPLTCAVTALNRLGYFGPGAWADAEGGLIATGNLDAL